jgi:hypothetical protein
MKQDALAILNIGGGLQLVGIVAGGYEVRAVLRNLRGIPGAVLRQLRDRLPSPEPQSQAHRVETTDTLGVVDTVQDDQTSEGSGTVTGGPTERRLRDLEQQVENLKQQVENAERQQTGSIDELRSALNDIENQTLQLIEAAEAGRAPTRLFILVTLVMGVAYATWAEPITDRWFGYAIALLTVPCLIGLFAYVIHPFRQRTATR